LKTTVAANRRYMAVLVPPGNVAREIALYRQRLFFAFGDPSARAFPEAIPLAFARRRDPSEPSPAAPEGAPAGGGFRARAKALLASAWSGIEGDFRAEGLLVESGSLYLSIAGPLEAIARGIEPRLPAIGLIAGGDPAASPDRTYPAPLVGFLLCRPPRPEAALATALALGPPRLRFEACCLSLYRLHAGDDPFAALSWTELAAAARPRRPRESLT